MVQAVQAAALTVVLYVEVATQEVQTVLAVGVQVADRYVPAAQLLQATHTAFAVTIQRGDA